MLAPDPQFQKCERLHEGTPHEASHIAPKGDGLAAYPEGWFQPLGPSTGVVPAMEERSWPMCRSYRIPLQG